MYRGRLGDLTAPAPRHRVFMSVLLRAIDRAVIGKDVAVIDERVR